MTPVLKFGIHVTLTCLCMLVISPQAQPDSTPNECTRGVKRSHPSQANVYQLFDRSRLTKKWIDFRCPPYDIFDPRECACVEKPVLPVAVSVDSPKVNNGGVLTNVSVDRDRNDPGNEGEGVEDQDNCRLHQPSPNSPSHYQRWTDGRWVTEDCNFPFYTRLEWNQLLCRCEWGTNMTSPIDLLDAETPVVCLVMLHVTFDSGEIKDEGRGVWMDIKGEGGASVVEDQTAVGGHSGSFRGSSLSIPFFKSNIIGPTFDISLRYKLCQGDPDTDIYLVHNGCPESSDGPSFVVSYQAWQSQITVSMRTLASQVPTQIYCNVKTPRPQSSWVKMDIRYHDNEMVVMIDDHVCATGSQFYGPMATNNCPLTLLDQSFCGNIDEVIITRGCTEEDPAVL